MLLPLKFNPTLHQLQQRGFQQDFSQLCSLPPSITIDTLIEPTCKLATGGFTLNFTNIPLPATISVDTRGTDYDVINAPLTEPTFTHQNIKAGPYYITVTDAYGKVHTFQFELNNDVSPPMEDSYWAVQSAYCSDSGRLIRLVVIPGAVAVYTVWEAHTDEFIYQIGNEDNLLAPGQYYVRARDTEGCESYFQFEVKAIPTLDLPFMDDFSTSHVYPDFNYWEDDLAFVNNTFPVNAPSLGVATLDGFNQYGQPYQSIDLGTGLINGSADTLTAQPSCLTFEGLTAGDTLYLSFFYQPQGRGDYPNEEDSLAVDLLANDGTWQTICSSGPNVSDSDPTFIYQRIAISDAKYWFDGFQFRFRNRATISGSNDHWHIDYVELDTVERDAIRQDVALTEVPGPMTERYFSMPWRHFINNLETYLADNVDVPVRNLDFTAANRTLQHTITDVCNNETIYAYDAGTATVLGNIAPLALTVESNAFISAAIADSLEDYAPTIADRDTVVLENEWQLSELGGGIDINNGNDVAYQYQKFYNYFAYDDETAEKAYGLLGIGSQVAYRFEIPEADVLRAVQINFLQHERFYPKLTD